MGDTTPWATLVIVRHGQSTWNKENIFTGWVDVDLSERGVEEARHAGRRLVEMAFVPDVAFSSVLTRAIRTLWVMLEEADLVWVPVHKSWRLNERHYGRLQGKNKAETTDQFGAEQVHIWRRSYAVRPPLLEPSSEMHPARDRRYQRDDIDADALPLGESLQDTSARVLPYWESDIAPQLQQRKNVLVAAHGNSLRALLKHLERVGDDDISAVNIPTGQPRIYEFDSSLQVISSRYHDESLSPGPSA